MQRRYRWGAVAVGLALVAAACGPGEGSATTDPAPDDSTTTTTTVPRPAVTFPPAPAVPDGPLSPEVDDALERVVSAFPYSVDREAVATIGDSGDPRLGWIIADVLRFSVIGIDPLLEAFEQLTGSAVDDRVPWVGVTDLMIAWDLPAPPGYLDVKRALFAAVDPRWEPFLTEPNDLDERLVTWGGVLTDDRPYGDPDPCETSCIPALDDPAVTDAAGGSWYPEDGIVFGVVVDGDARAYPRNIMEVHELVNDQLGGRQIAVPYCTLCGSAEAFFTDGLDEGLFDPIMRTSGLLVRSNKVMYDLLSGSVFDTFTGRAVSGPLWEAQVQLERTPIVTSTWAAWKEAHPGTTIVAQDGGIGRIYSDDPLGGRDDFGPIFPIGERDPRLEAQEQVVGVTLDDGTAIAFPADAAREALLAGETVDLAGVEIRLVGDGLIAFQGDRQLPSKQSFWFAWSQFHPETLLWSR